jgi:hypothetical protein
LIFRDDFREFALKRYAFRSDGQANPAISTLIDFEVALDNAQNGGTAIEPPSGLEVTQGPVAGHVIPRVAKTVRMVKVGADLGEVIYALTEKRSLDTVLSKPGFLALRRNLRNEIEVAKLNASASALLSLCDGVRTVDEIAATTSAVPEATPADNHRSVSAILEGLCREGFVEIDNGKRARGSQQSPPYESVSSTVEV